MNDPYDPRDPCDLCWETGEIVDPDARTVEPCSCPRGHSMARVKADNAAAGSSRQPVAGAGSCVERSVSRMCLHRTVRDHMATGRDQDGRVRWRCSGCGHVCVWTVGHEYFGALECRDCHQQVAEEVLCGPCVAKRSPGRAKRVEARSRGREKRLSALRAKRERLARQMADLDDEIAGLAALE